MINLIITESDQAVFKTEHIMPPVIPVSLTISYHDILGNQTAVAALHFRDQIKPGQRLSLCCVWDPRNRHSSWWCNAVYLTCTPARHTCQAWRSWPRGCAGSLGAHSTGPGPLWSSPGVCREEWALGTYLSDHPGLHIADIPHLTIFLEQELGSEISIMSPTLYRPFPSISQHFPVISEHHSELMLLS